MTDTIDLGAAPANEPCAQLGVTPEFERINRLEVKIYAVAIQARFGPPPAGISFVTVANRHDFGTYYTLGMRIDRDCAASLEAAAYLEAAQDGLASWLEAGIAPPVHYDDAIATRVRSDVNAVIRGALATTRPDAGGRFPLADFATLHSNLLRAFPAVAETWRAPEPERLIP